LICRSRPRRTTRRHGSTPTWTSRRTSLARCRARTARAPGSPRNRKRISAADAASEAPAGQAAAGTVERREARVPAVGRATTPHPKVAATQLAPTINGRRANGAGLDGSTRPRLRGMSAQSATLRPLRLRRLHRARLLQARLHRARLRRAWVLQLRRARLRRVRHAGVAGELAAIAPRRRTAPRKADGLTAVSPQTASRAVRSLRRLTTPR
jgi:hypothetical protein